MDRIDELQSIVININDIMKAMQEQLDGIEKELEELSGQHSRKVWHPTIGEKYYYIDDDGRIESDSYDDHEFDKERFDFYNGFKTEELATRERFEILLKRKLKAFAKEHNDNTIDLDDPNQHKYYITYDSKTSELIISCCVQFSDFNAIYYTSPEVAAKATEVFKHDLLRYYTTNE